MNIINSLRKKTKYMAGIICLLIFAAALISTFSSGGGGGDTDGGTSAGQPLPDPLMGMLQFRIKHNLHDDTCQANGDCNLVNEEEENTVSWLADIAKDSNLAVLHWDRAIPWLAFDTEVPQDSNRINFFDARIDNALLSWINAFADHFEAMPAGYLAVTALHGERNRISSYRIDGQIEEVETSDACPDFAPGTMVNFQYNTGSGPVNASFDLERSYTNFVLYLYDKLQPDYFAIQIEANVFKRLCPGKWEGFSELYHAVYDTVREEVSPDTKVFATMTYKDLLDYDLVTCHGSLVFEPCSGEPDPPDLPVPDIDKCYPMDLSAINDFNQGERLEILGLSFYPDALFMDVSDKIMIKLHPEDWNGSDNCTTRTYALPFLDPIAALDRLGWTKPIAIGELGARSCTTFAFSLEEPNTDLLEYVMDINSQAFWIDHFMKSVQNKKFEFYVQVFREDYPPIGLWTVQDSGFPKSVFNIYNSFPCMGLYTEDGQSKPDVTDAWLSALEMAAGN